MHVMTDLAAYYDRQLLNIESMIVELVGVDRAFMKLVAKILLSIEHHICIGYRVSRESYGNAKENYAETG